MLLKLLREANADLLNPAAQTLQQLGADKAEVLSILAENMKDANKSTRYYSALPALLFDPGNPSAVAILLDTVRTEPSMRKAATDPDKTIGEAARRTLKHIERPAAAP